MQYQQVLDRLNLPTDEQSLATEIGSLIEEMVGSQQNNVQNSLRDFILHHQSPIGLRISSALKYLAQFLEEKPTSPTDYKGVVEAFYTRNSNHIAEGFLLIGAPNVQGILFCIQEDRVKNTTTIRRVVSEIIDPIAKSVLTAQVGHDTKSFISFSNVTTALSQLEKLMTHKPLVEVEKDIFDKPEYTQALYKGFWQEGKSLKDIQSQYKTSQENPAT